MTGLGKEDSVLERVIPDFRTFSSHASQKDEQASVAPLRKPSVQFSEIQFFASHLAEQFAISKPTIYDLINEGVLTPSSHTKRGNTKVAVFGWDAVQAIAERYKSRMRGKKLPLTVTVANMKGGTGKSTITTQVAMTAASMGVKTLILDFDPQMHASKAIHFEGSELKTYPTIKDVLISDIPIRDTIVEITPLLFILPANLKLSRLELEIFPLHNREELIIEHIKDISADFDLVLIDTNPSASVLNIASIAACDDVWIVSETDHFSTDGLGTIFDVLKSVKKSFKRCPKINIIANLFDVREGIAREAVGFLETNFSDVLAPTVMSKCQDFKEAQRKKQAVWQHNRKSIGAKEIFSLTRELLDIRGVSNA